MAQTIPTDTPTGTRRSRGRRTPAGVVGTPKVIHRCWLGGPEPEWLRGFAETWDRPGWELRQWDDESVTDLFPLRNQRIWDSARQIAPKHVGQLRSDVLRYEILHRFGGVWVDADFELLRPIDDLLEDVECFAAWEVTNRWIANGFMGARPGHPFIERLIVGLERNVTRLPGRRPNKLSGPQYFTKTWRQHGGGVHIFPREFFYPFGWDEVEDYAPGEFDPAERWPEALACHWWANQRREREIVPCPS